ncbi:MULTISPECIES: N-formylglutamate amidohydrolase [Agrobacterium]|uniref:N-formylglutamate amidohydrolase n=1 Tax=Agrobacterium pusense TaxID=648995 RepID=A0A6H0ZM76_9HYPH|nr:MULTISPECIES: N-formylglutamate amidohydrolase [Agrobacterium]ANV23383.1 N-formylglutamate amidohydrolase [Rhizobium sp. S41]KGE83854.1 N-formylglutamate amidohydrolase [Rhizobium sp. H41]HAU76419.1 N-formylglutamate amidohydrolase [Agrobacterium sp.]MDH0869234.1 N-formylglutamate amidohydrolase [Agrobacterium pusense]MDH1270802.1 N-formylglutamate amidohydrolase [Agrobacterium pusense]
MTVRSRFFTEAEGQAVGIENAGAAGDVLLVCEHASATVPQRFGTLGLSPEVLSSHVAWDPGALAVARLLSEKLDATLIYQRFSRLVYDCNRPPESPSAMPVKSEVYDIPGNFDLTEAERFARTSALYVPFHDRVSEIIAERQANGRKVVVVTIHSFTPVYHGRFREVEMGILHDTDSRLADAMLTGAEGASLMVNRNDPYGPEDGVTHTLRLHALPDGLLNVMIEIRNDLIADEGEQANIAAFLHELMGKALASIDE